MTRKIAVKAWSFGVVALFMLTTLPGAFAQHLVKADVPFTVHVGAKALPAGAYEFKIDRGSETVTVHGTQGADSVIAFMTTLGVEQHTTATDAHLVFDKVGSTYTLSEVWEPGLEGILLYATKGKHQHEIINEKR